jgi:hypothetical protein
MSIPDFNINVIHPQWNNHKIYQIAFEFGYFENSLRDYFNTYDIEDNIDVFHFRIDKDLTFDTCALDETYIRYCLNNKITTIQFSNYILFHRLLYNKNYRLFQKLFMEYKNDIPDVVKEQFIEYFLVENTNKRNKFIPLIIENTNINLNDILTNSFVQFIKKNNLPIIRFLVERGVDVNANNGHALRRAIYRNYTDILNYLVQLPHIEINCTHFTQKQYLYLQRKNKLNQYIIKLFQTHNPKLINNVDDELLLACSTQDNQKMKCWIEYGANILSLGSVLFVFHHPIYSKNEFLLETYARKYFALKKISRILFGRRGIIHNIQYKLGRKRVFAEFESLEEEISKKVRFS